MTLYYSKFRIFKLEKLGGEFLVNTTKEFKVMLPLKYLFNFGFWNTFEIREIDYYYYKLLWTDKPTLFTGTAGANFKTIDAKLYVAVATTVKK